MLMHMVRVGIVSAIALAGALPMQAEAASILVNGDSEDGTYTGAVGGYTGSVRSFPVRSGADEKLKVAHVIPVRRALL